MFRRNFLKRFTLGGATGAAALGLAQASGTQSVSYRVKGFTCVTCAVGLDTILKAENGVLRSKSTYPEGKVVIEFDPHLVAEARLRQIIAECGFGVERAA